MLVAICSTSLFISCTEDEEPSLTEYGSISAADKTTLYTESFDNNSAGWDVTTDATQLFAVTAGKYELTSKVSTSKASFRSITDIAIDFTKNHEFEIQLKSFSPATFFSFAYNIDAGFANTFSLTYTTGKATFTRLDGTFSDLIDVASPTVAAGTDIKMTIRVIGGQIYCFVNETFIGQAPYVGNTSKQISFRTGENTKTEIYSFVVSQLN